MLLTNLPLARSVMAMLASSLLLMMSVLLTPAATAVTGAVCALEEVRESDREREQERGKH